MAETWRGVGPSGHCKEGKLGKQMECQSLRKINEAAIGANWRHVEPRPQESGYSCVCVCFNVTETDGEEKK